MSFLINCNYCFIGTLIAYALYINVSSGRSFRKLKPWMVIMGQQLIPDFNLAVVSSKLEVNKGAGKGTKVDVEAFGQLLTQFMEEKSDSVKVNELKSISSILSPKEKNQDQNATLLWTSLSEIIQNNDPNIKNLNDLTHFLPIPNNNKSEGIIETQSQKNELETSEKKLEKEENGSLVWHTLNQVAARIKDFSSNDPKTEKIETSSQLPEEANVKKVSDDVSGKNDISKNDVSNKTPEMIHFTEKSENPVVSQQLDNEKSGGEEQENELVSLKSDRKQNESKENFASLNHTSNKTKELGELKVNIPVTHSSEKDVSNKTASKEENNPSIKTEGEKLTVVSQEKSEDNVQVNFGSEKNSKIEKLQENHIGSKQQATQINSGSDSSVNIISSNEKTVSKHSTIQTEANSKQGKAEPKINQPVKEEKATINILSNNTKDNLNVNKSLDDKVENNPAKNENPTNKADTTKQTKQRVLMDTIRAEESTKNETNVKQVKVNSTEQTKDNPAKNGNPTDKADTTKQTKQRVLMDTIRAEESTKNETKVKQVKVNSTEQTKDDKEHNQATLQRAEWKTGKDFQNKKASNVESKDLYDQIIKSSTKEKSQSNPKTEQQKNHLDNKLARNLEKTNEFKTKDAVQEQPDKSSLKSAQNNANYTHEKVRQNMERTIIENWSESKPPSSSQRAQVTESTSTQTTQANHSASASTHSTISQPQAAAQPETSQTSMAKMYTEQIAKMQESASQQIVRSVQGSMGSERSHISLQLQPQHLGKVHIQLKIEGGHLSAEMTAMKSGTREMLQQSIQHLRSAFDDQGIKVEKISVRETNDSRSQDQDSRDKSSNSRNEQQGDQRNNQGGRQKRNPFAEWWEQYTSGKWTT